MAKGKARTSNIGVVNRVHRPRLTPSQAALQAKYHPADPCRHCAEAGRDRNKTGQTYLLDPSGSTDARLAYYCNVCGYYVMVERAAGAD